MTLNFKFCNGDFLSLYCYNPSKFYNQFNLPDKTRVLIDSMGEHPDFHLVFKYNPEKKIRATFIVFDGELRDMDVKCICTLFHGDRFENYCYFYEVYEDSTIGCVQVAHGFDDERIVMKLDVGTDVDAYFDDLCANLSDPPYQSVAMLYYKESDDCFRLLDVILSELPDRCLPLLGGDPDVETKTIGGVEFLLYKSKENSSFLAARTTDGKNPTDAMLSDTEILK